MATETPEAPQGFKKADAPDTDNDTDFDTEWVDRPEPSELLQGNLLAIKEDRGQYDTTVLELRLTEPYGDHEPDDLVCLWSTNGIDAALDENDVRRGDEIALLVDETWETDDGESRRNYAVYTED
jgi:hypothetical protein